MTSTPRKDDNQIIGGTCQVPFWESWRMRQRHRIQRLLASILFGKRLQWIYWKYLREGSENRFAEPPSKLWHHLYWLECAFWSHMCGSDDLALEYFIRTFFPNYQSKKWRTLTTPHQ